jgi:lipid-A-disaccharide synthase
MTNHRLYVIAGEASGDLHGSNLVKALFSLNSDLVIRGWGGDLMSTAGVDVVKHYRELAFMGFAEVIKHLPEILRNFKNCKKDILEFKPDAVILIDYPGFNIRMAKWLKQQGIKVIYYIAPQVWAWNASRVHTLKKVVDLMLVILPFEKEFFRKYGMEVQYVGHPLMEARDAFLMEKELNAEKTVTEKKTIALLPGSRKQEISTVLPLMLSVISDFPDARFVIAGASAQADEFYEAIVTNTTGQSIISHPQIEYVKGRTYQLLSEADAALVTSGTATLETALFKVPQVVCYKGSYLSYQIARRVIRVPYISLVNLIMDKPFVTELIQEDLNPERIKMELNRLLDPTLKGYFEKEYSDLESMLRQEKPASQKAAELIIASLN